jgi:hypothetical protein
VLLRRVEIEDGAEWQIDQKCDEEPVNEPLAFTIHATNGQGLRPTKDSYAPGLTMSRQRATAAGTYVARSPSRAPRTTKAQAPETSADLGLRIESG